MTTAKLGLPEWEQNQSQPYVTVDQALRILDAAVQLTVIDRDLTAPPGSPSDGDTYIVAVSATGDWAGQDGKIAYYSNTAWVFVTPAEGWRAWVTDEDVTATYQNGAWAGVGQAETVKALGSISGAQSLDLRESTYWQFTVGGAMTLSFAGLPPAGTVKAVTLEITGSSSSPIDEITWPAAVEWPGGVALQPTQAGTDVFVLVMVGADRILAGRAMEALS